MIKFLDLHKVNSRFENEFKQKFQQFLNAGHYVLGAELEHFEKRFAAYCGTRYALGVGNGLEALVLIFKSYVALGILKKGDEVLVPANTYIASILAIIHADLIPILVEPSLVTYNLDPEELAKHQTSKTKAILAVHLYGQLANMKAISIYAKVNKLLVIEDAAQAHGATDSFGKRAGNLSGAAAFSFYPSKNLGALGDAGAITSNDKKLIEMVGLLRNYGSKEKYKHETIGFNSRMDTLQAAFLNIKLDALDADNQRRQQIGNTYLSKVKNKKITLPFYDGTSNHVFHVFVVLVENRKEFVKCLEQNGVETLIHYPIPPHQQNALQHLNTLSFPITETIHKNCVSLPMSPVMTDTEVLKVIQILNTY